MRTFICLLCLISPYSVVNAAPLANLLQSTEVRWVAYSPSRLDPRQDIHHEQLSTAQLQADLRQLSDAFNGLILYAWHPMVTPRLLWLAEQEGFKAVLLGVWQPRSAAELDGVITLSEQYRDKLAVGIVVGNEGINFGRYEFEDLLFAEDYLRQRLSENVLLTTSEPLVGYQDARLLGYGDFLAPNIHPAIDRDQLAPGPAADWARGEALKLAERSGKSVLVKETGLPRGGRADYNPEVQAAFWQHYTEKGLSQKAGDGVALFNVAFEAYDLPWKAEASGLPIEAWWGLLSQTRVTTPAFRVWQQLGEP